MKQEAIGKYIKFISKHADYFLNKKLNRYNITSNQIEIMTFLCKHEGISHNELGEALKLDKITVTKRVKNLVEEGYLKKAGDPGDKRTKRLYLTSKGYQFKDEIEDILKELEEILSAGITGEEKALLIKLLKKSSENIYNEVHNLKHKD